MALQNGTSSPTLATRTQLGTTVTAEGNYQVYVDVAALTSTEYLIIEVEIQTSSGGSWRQWQYATVGADNSDGLVASIPAASPWGWRVYITQQNGTARSFPWWFTSL